MRFKVETFTWYLCMHIQREKRHIAHYIAHTLHIRILIVYQEKMNLLRYLHFMVLHAVSLRKLKEINSLKSCALSLSLCEWDCRRLHILPYCSRYYESICEKLQKISIENFSIDCAVLQSVCVCVCLGRGKNQFQWICRGFFMVGLKTNWKHSALCSSSLCNPLL